MRILLIDDEDISRGAIFNFLNNQLGHEVTECGSAAEALKIYKTAPFPLIISDIRMPGMSGIDLLEHIKKLPEGKFTDFVLVTGYGSMESAVQALRSGAYDYLLKPINIEELANLIEKIEEHITLLRENMEYKFHFDKKVDEAAGTCKEQFKELQKAFSKIVGTGGIGFFSQKMEDIKELALKLHADRAVPVLIEGETGTGKDVIARLIHYGQGDVMAPFISINCTAIPPTLFETELFGYEEGAFTDARKKGATGKFELAQGGTILLDEIGDLPLEIQPKLLRILEERAFYRVGGVKKIKLDIRIICATNQDLEEKIKAGKFRQDLFYRLNVGRVYAPPLRRRKEEIAPLAQMFLQRLAVEKKKGFRSFQEESSAILESYDWPGNIRQLQNTIERVVLLYDDTYVRAEHLDFLSGEAASGTVGAGSPENQAAPSFSLHPGQIELPPLRLNLKELEEEIVRKVLEKFAGNKTRAAAYLGLTRSALRSKIKG
ncbi:MAG: sigma-54-dependent Fis family transcriptional regulator [Candidatus Aminicenantes bacterium]|nr:sigma-54-dependent Fis family transcriptional regulator [Candidatus Aminicenantes bacterium]